MKTGVHRASRAQERLTIERVHILEVTTGREDPRVSIARARVEPGVTTALHRLEGVDERYLIVAGRAAMNVGDSDDWVAVGPGDVVVIPAGTPQRIRNLANDKDLVFYCVCSPPFAPSCYRHLE